MILRGSLGLGDAIHLWPVVKYYVELGKDVTIITRYPEIYKNLKCTAVSTNDFIDCQSSSRTKISETNIFDDVLISAGIEKKIPFEFSYENHLPLKINTMKKICVVRIPTVPVKGEDCAKVMLPKLEIYQNIINVFHEKVYFVSVGWQKNCNYKLSGIDLDMSKTNDLDTYFSIIDSADIVLTQPGHCVPIAEALKKKLFCIFAYAGLMSEEKRYRFTTPAKILTRKESTYCIDNEIPKAYLEKFERLLND